MPDPKRAWTEGPWQSSGCVVHVVGSPYSGAIVSAYNQHEQTAANGDLIALAPEMAEAILAWSEGQHGDFDAQTRGIHAMHDLTKRLRAIGNTEESNHER